ncbi:MAG TPA: hypothetical protein VL688_00085 [Verrucomicrobiae bacterium]|jgi:hypothetical protein|nr:hypothetical protein [Verrucomicrobiae bacterium]
MREFWVGLLVLIMMGVLSVAGVLLLPVLLVMGIFLRIIIGILILIAAIWMVGKVTLLLLGSSKKNHAPKEIDQNQSL